MSKADVSIQNLIHDDDLTGYVKRARARFLARRRSIIASQTNGTVNHANIITGFTHQDDSSPGPLVRHYYPPRRIAFGPRRSVDRSRKKEALTAFALANYPPPAIHAALPTRSTSGISREIDQRTQRGQRAVSSRDFLHRPP